MDLASWLLILINGICTGALYGLLSASFSFQLGALKTLNFAYGSFIMLGMYILFFAMNSMRLPILAAIAFLLIVYFIVGFVLRATFLKNPKVSPVIITIAIAIVLENLVLFVAGPRSRTILTGIPPVWRIDMGEFGQLNINMLSILILAVSVVTLFAFAIFLKKTWLGMAIRSAVQQRETVYLMGLDSEKIIAIGFGISFILLAIASSMVAVRFVFVPDSGSQYMFYGLLVCMLAGIGNLRGALYAGIMVGIVSSAINLTIAQWHEPILITLYIIVLALFPDGIFTSKKNLLRKV